MIPEPGDQIGQRKNRGSCGARPVTFDAEHDKGRNVVERAFNKLENWRGLAARYDKHTLVYRGGMVLGLDRPMAAGLTSQTRPKRDSGSSRRTITASPGRPRPIESRHSYGPLTWLRRPVCQAGGSPRRRLDRTARGCDQPRHVKAVARLQRRLAAGLGESWDRDAFEGSTGQ